MRHVIIVNPVAGKKRNISIGKRVYKLLKKYGIESEIFISEYKGHITEYVTKIANIETCRLYSLGGDGTLNEIVTGIYGTSSDIVVIPAGTGNDFIKNYGKYKSMRKIIINSIDKEATKVDVLKIGKHTFCINILSAGFDAMVAKNLDVFRNVPLVTGKFKYSLSIIYTLFSSRNFKFKVRIDGDKVVKKDFTLIAVSNGKYYGGGISPCPDANIYDATLDICLADKTNLLKKLKLLPKYKKGTHTDLKEVSILKAQKISIVSNKKFPANIDGEVFYTNKLNIQIIPQSINIVVI